MYIRCFSGTGERDQGANVHKTDERRKELKKERRVHSAIMAVPDFSKTFTVDKRLAVITKVRKVLCLTLV